VGRWLGGACGCEGRRDRLNALGAWARRVLAGKREQAVEYLDRIIGEGDNDQPTPYP